MTMLAQIRAMKPSGEKIAVLTCYDASFAVLMEQAGIDVLLVGDSLGMVLQGSTDTLGVTMQDMQYHTRCVAKGAKTSPIVADMSVGSYRTPEQALENAKTLLAAGAHVVKVEGGKTDVVRHLVTNGIAVCGHLGFTPQSVRELGGYKVQGKDEVGAQKILDDAFVLQQAGACMLVLEMVPAALARHITAELAIPTIGIGAGAGCDGQVLVLQDMLGIYPGKTPKFARNFMLGVDSVQAALAEYVKSVKDGSFPAAKHSF
jgi:3-methyl-2-oxobutanoate hydroxymethyltransferase